MALAQLLPPGTAGYEVGRRVGMENQAQQVRSLAQLAQMVQGQQALGLKREDIEGRAADRKLAMQDAFLRHRETIGARLKIAEDGATAKIEAARQAGADRATLMEMQITARRELAAAQEAARKDLAQFMVQNRPEQTPVVIPDAASPTGFKYGRREEAIGGPAPAPGRTQAKDASDSEKLSAGYATRMVESAKLIDGITSSGKETGTPGVIESMAGTLPMVGNLAANISRSPERQRYRQAQEDWVRAKLRKESGAVIGNEEMDREIRVYFPQLGDGKEVIKQKAASRKIAEQAMIKAAGRAWEQGAPETPASTGGWGIKRLD